MVSTTLSSSMIGVAEAKRRFSELLDRVKRGERFVIHRRGVPVVALVSPEEILRRPQTPPIGLAAVAGALEEWDDLEEVLDEIISQRAASVDRSVPDLE